MIARQLGLWVVLIEKGRHPRVVIGESTTPLSNLLLEQLADRYSLPRLKPLTKWGTWQDKYPTIVCGLKRGFSFYHHTLGSPSVFSICERQLLVAASPNDTIADTHWYRADVDALLVQQAQELGSDYIDNLRLEAPVRIKDGWLLSGERGATNVTLEADFLLDATGPRGYLHHSLHLEEIPLPDYPETSALYSHFSSVAEFGGSSKEPFPVDAAAVHHVFDGGWIWVLRFNNGVTSAGVAARSCVAERLGLATKEQGWERLMAALPDVGRQFSQARREMDFHFIPRLAFHSARVSGPGWALMPAAAGFVDPLLSSGFPLSLFGVDRIADILEKDWRSPRFEQGIERYAQRTHEDLLATALLIRALYRCMNNFVAFRAISLLYFTAASYAESARRLGKSELAGSFLMHDHPVFGPASRHLLARASQSLDAAETRRLEDDVYRLIGAFDVAGLSARPVDHCYPVRAEDLFASGHKLGAERGEIESMLQRAGFPS